MSVRNVAVGFLYPVDSGNVLLHPRNVDKPPEIGKWALFGGQAEQEY